MELSGILANVDQAKTWNGDEASHWVRYAEQYDQSIRRHNLCLREAAAVSPSDEVLDVGCGCGESTREAAQSASAGWVLGVDLSYPMLHFARRQALVQRLSNIAFVQADAQVQPFTAGTFEVVISRFGAMFFNNPVAAFSNIGRALRRGGRLVMLTWQGLAKNEWLMEIRAALGAGRDQAAPPEDVPGPFGLASAGVVRQVLTAAGFGNVRLTDVREPLILGADAEAAFSFARTLGITRGLLRDIDKAAAAQALDRLRAVLTAHETTGGVEFGSAAWLVSACRQ